MIFQQATVESGEYEMYANTFIGNDNPPFDANSLLGFWCAPCPSRSSCTFLNVSMQTMLPENGYFRGIGTSVNLDECD
jgi:hypothetical protein